MGIIGWFIGYEKEIKKVIFFIVESEISFRFAPANINSTHVQGNFGKAFNFERFGVVLKKRSVSSILTFQQY